MIGIPLLRDGTRGHIPPRRSRGGPGHPALRVASALDEVRRAPTILESIRSVPKMLDIVDEMAAVPSAGTTLLEPIREAIDEEDDSLTALAAIHALGRIPGLAADEALIDVIVDARPGYLDHALWAVRGRAPSPALLRPVTRALARGSLAGAHAQRTLAAWASSDATRVLRSLEAILDEQHTATARRYLVESVGLVPGQAASRSLVRIALERTEPREVRETAVSAFSERLDEDIPAAILKATDDELRAVVRDTQARRRLARRGPRRARAGTAGIGVAQVHLGPYGGLATLLPTLGQAMAQGAHIAEVVTIVRASEPFGITGPTASDGHRLEPVALPPDEGISFGGSWPALVAVARGIRTALLAGTLPDIVHLRMADPGSHAAAAVARELGIPTVFTLAPDPHGPIAAAESAGTLDRRRFAAADARDALWFRTDLVDRLARAARELVLFPRAGHAGQLRALTGIDLSSGARRHTIVAEGVDTSRLDAAAEIVRAGTEKPQVLVDLQAAIRRLPRQRHGLPLVISVGRLHAVKGMSRLVEAFALDEALAARANLVIVGGQLDAPSAAEAAELSRIRLVEDRYPALGDRLVLLGQRSHDEVALVMAAARLGWGTLIGESGAYACASSKEEFGLAIVEAMAAGLPVVAPGAGGPPTYVEVGVTGVLVESQRPGVIAGAIHRALDLALDPATAPAARAVVDAHYTLSRMARRLSAVYGVAVGAGSLGDAVGLRAEAAA